MGTRWWIEINEAGDETWVFESRVNNPESQNKKYLFWIFQGLSTFVLLMILCTNIYYGDSKLILLLSVAVCQSYLNVWAFYRCLRGTATSIEPPST